MFQKGGRTYCRAMAGDEEDVTSSSYTWLDESESPLRTGKLCHAVSTMLQRRVPHCLCKGRSGAVRGSSAELAQRTVAVSATMVKLMIAFAWRPSQAALQSSMI